MKRRRRQILGILVIVGLPTFLMATNPESLPLPLLVLPFIWLFTIFFLSARLVMHKLRLPLAERQQVSIAAVLSASPVLLIVLSSIGQLTVNDTLIMAGLLLGIVFYIERLDLLE